ncbi:MAG TPA: hypothetical protein HA272_07165 [Methanoregula sp.]|nr:hypothetical protein [Methanoregula sp.]
MDELIAVGTAGLLGLALTALLLLAGILWISSLVWEAWCCGNWSGVIAAGCALFVFALAYAGAGIWLQKTGRI